MTEELKDQQLLARLAAALDTYDPLPEAVITAAKETFTWRTIDAELASLVFDSAAEELAGVRSTDATRQMTFRTTGVEIELVVLSKHHDGWSGSWCLHRPPRSCCITRATPGLHSPTAWDVLPSTMSRLVRSG